MLRRITLYSLLLCAWLLAVSTASALSPESAKAIAVGENDDRIKALSAALVTPDDNLSNLVDALLGDTAKIAGEQILIVNDAATGKAVNAATGAETPLPATVEDVVNNNRMRQALEAAKAAFGLFSDSLRVRNNAITELRESDRKSVV